MSGVNKIILLGRCCKGVEVKHLEGGNTVARFTLATSETYKDKTTGEKKEVTEWHTVTFWGKLAEIAEKYVKKGDMVYVEGKVKYRNYTDKDGVVKYFTEISGENITLLGNKPPQQESTQTTQGVIEDKPKDTFENQPVSEEDDLPF